MKAATDPSSGLKKAYAAVGPAFSYRTTEAPLWLKRISEPGAVATGHEIQQVLAQFIEYAANRKLSLGPVATAPGSDKLSWFYALTLLGFSTGTTV